MINDRIVGVSFDFFYNSINNNRCYGTTNEIYVSQEITYDAYENKCLLQSFVKSFF